MQQKLGGMKLIFKLFEKNDRVKYELQGGWFNEYFYKKVLAVIGCHKLMLVILNPLKLF